MYRAISSSIALVLLAGACSKNSQAPDGEPLVRRAEPGEAIAVGKPEQGPGATRTMPMPVGPMAAVPGGGAGGDGATTFAARCASCHGAAGRGDGMMAAAFAVKPRSFADAAWQQSVTDAQIAAVIVGGSAAAGKSSTMPANPDLAQQPALVDALVRVVRQLGGAK